MIVEVELRAIILAAPAVLALMADRAYPVILPQKPELPALTYQRISGGTRVSSHAGDTGLALARIQIDCWAQTYLAAKDLAATVRKTLQAGNRQLAKGAVPAGSTGVIRKVDVTLDRDDYEDGDVIKLYRAGFDVLTWFKED